MNEVWLWVLVSGSVLQLVGMVVMGYALAVLAIRYRLLRDEVDTQKAVLLQLAVLAEPRRQVDPTERPVNRRRTMWSEPVDDPRTTST